jgi:LL-diaminopimelate aminotransferase
VASKPKLERLVAYAKEHKTIILYDAAYSPFIQNEEFPRSIFEIEGADEVALEMSSFSKLAGFTGVRLAWTVVPERLCYEDGSPVMRDWNRLMSTLFNGASNISQKGGIAVLDPEGLQETRELIAHYLGNAMILKEALENKGLEVFGGVHAPYLWVRFPGRKSWEVFQEFLENLHLVTTPGAGFGPSGEGFLRLTAFGKRPETLDAAERIANYNFTSRKFSWSLE